MKKKESFYIIGVDGGASKTRGVLFSNSGETLAIIIEKGSNLSLNGELASDRIENIIYNLCKNSKIPTDHVGAVGLGLSGSSNQNGRDMVFGKLDRMQLSKRTLIMNDAEAAYEVNCPGNFGILVTVGTGVICISRSAGKTIREAGKGHEEGDIGSGYWIGKQSILNLTLNETTVLGDCDLEEIMEVFLTHVNEEKFQSALENLNEDDEAVFIIAGLAEHIINLAEKGNEIALSVLQEATNAVADYILALTETLKYKKNNIVLAGNGSIIKNDFFRMSVNDELRFNFPEIKWVFSTISPAYGAGIMAARLHDVEVKVSDILKGDILVPA